MDDAKLALIDERIQTFELLLEAIKESQADLNEINVSLDKIKKSTNDNFDSVDSNQKADLFDNTSERQLSHSINNSTYIGGASLGSITLPIPIKLPKCSLFSSKKRNEKKAELRRKSEDISQASPKDNGVLTSELSKQKQRTSKIPRLKSLITYLETKPDPMQIKTRSFTTDPLTMKIMCKARNKKAETKIFSLKMSKNDIFVDSEILHMQLISCIQSVGKDSKYVKCHCSICLSGKPAIGRSDHLLNHLYRTQNIAIHCCYCDKRGTQNMRIMRKHIQKYHWSSGEILQDAHEEDEQENR